MDVTHHVDLIYRSDLCVDDTIDDGSTSEVGAAPAEHVCDPEIQGFPV